jgi:hypothetical protein
MAGLSLNCEESDEKSVSSTPNKSFDFAQVTSPVASVAASLSSPLACAKSPLSAHTPSTQSDLTAALSSAVPATSMIFSSSASVSSEVSGLSVALGANDDDDGNEDNALNQNQVARAEDDDEETKYITQVLESGREFSPKSQSSISSWPSSDEPGDLGSDDDDDSSDDESNPHCTTADRQQASNSEVDTLADELEKKL